MIWAGRPLPDPGTAADMVLVEGNPMESISTLRRPVLVVAHGRVVFSRRGRGEV